MPIGSSKLGVLGAGLVPGGSVTFNSSGNWTVPPGVKKVSITGRGGTGNPGNAGNPGNPGNPGTGGAGGGGGTFAGPGPLCSSFNNCNGAGAPAFRTYWPTSPTPNRPGYPANYIFRAPIQVARTRCLTTDSPVGAQFPNILSLGGAPAGPTPNPCQQRASGVGGQSGINGSGGTAGNPGNPGNTGQSSSALGNNFAGGAGGNAGVAGNAGTGGSGGTGGGGGNSAYPSLANYVGPFPAIPAANLNALQANGGQGGSGGTGGGNGGNGARSPGSFSPNQRRQTYYGAHGGAGAGSVNSGQNGKSSTFIQSCPSPLPAVCANIQNCRGRNPVGGTGNVNAPTSVFPVTGGPSVDITPRACPSGSFGTSTNGGFGGNGGGSLNFFASPQSAVAGASVLAGGSGIIKSPAPSQPVPAGMDIWRVNPACNNSCTRKAFGMRLVCCQFTPNIPNPAFFDVFRGGGGGGAGGVEDAKSSPCAPSVAQSSGGGGGGGGRGNAGNAGGGSPTPTGSAANPATFNCVTVTPGATVPITVGAPGGQINISWNPQ